MSDEWDPDLVDAINSWTERADDLDDADHSAIVRLQRAIDESPWSRVPVEDLTSVDIEAISSALGAIESRDYVDWVIAEAIDDWFDSPADDQPYAWGEDDYRNGWDEADEVIILDDTDTEPATPDPDPHGSWGEPVAVADLETDGDSESGLFADVDDDVEEPAEDAARSDLFVDAEDVEARDESDLFAAVEDDAGELAEEAVESDLFAAVEDDAGEDDAEEAVESDLFADVGDGDESDLFADADDEVDEPGEDAAESRVFADVDDEVGEPAEDAIADVDDHVEDAFDGDGVAGDDAAAAGHDADSHVDPDDESSDGPVLVDDEDPTEDDEPESHRDLADADDDVESGHEDDASASDDDPGPAVGGAFLGALSAPDDESDSLTAGAFSGSLGTDPDLLAPLISGEGDADDARADAFFAALDQATSTTVTGPVPAEFRDGPDILGPSFLPPPEPRGRLRRVGLAAVTIVALVAFVYAGLQLVNNVNEPDDVATSTDPDGDDDAGADEDPDDESADESDPDTSDDGSEDDATEDSDGDDLADDQDGDEVDEDSAAAGSDDDEPDEAEPTPIPAPTAMPEGASAAVLRLDDGSVWVVPLDDDGAGEPRGLLDPEAMPAAIDIAPVRGGFAFVDEAGDAHVAPLGGPDDPSMVWSADRMGEAAEIVEANDKYVVLTTGGSIALFGTDAPATRARTTVVWDTSIGGTPPAQQIDAYVDLVPFAIANGDVQMIVSSSDDLPLIPIWDAVTQPRVFNLAIDENGLLMGVGAGAVARYQWFEEGPQLTAVWDPLDGSRLPAIAYAGRDDGSAIVLNTGTVAVITDDGTSIAWDAEVTDEGISAIASVDEHLLLRTVTGTVLLIDPSDPSDPVLVWDAESDGRAVEQMVVVTS